MEIVSKLPYYRFVVHDVRGVETIKAMLFKQIEMPQSPYWTEWLYLFFLFLSLILGVVISYKVNRGLAIRLNVQKNITILNIMPFIFIISIFAVAMAYQLL
jgi:ABC-type microcin C transport system permease subunit YejE